MSRRIEVAIGDARATFVLLEEWAPKMTSLIWEVLPLTDALLRHGKLSGEATFLVVDDPRFAALATRPELGVSSIYKGFMVAHARPERASVELLFSYGLAEYRWPDGRRYVVPVAEVEGDASRLFAAMQRTWAEGATRISVRRVE